MFPRRSCFFYCFRWFAFPVPLSALKSHFFFSGSIESGLVCCGGGLWRTTGRHSRTDGPSINNRRASYAGRASVASAAATDFILQSVPGTRQ